MQRVVFAQKGSIEVDLEKKQLLFKLNGTRFEQRDDSAPNDLTKIRDGITMQDAAGRVIYANDVAARMCGFDSASEMLAAPMADYPTRFALYDADDGPIDYYVLNWQKKVYVATINRELDEIEAHTRRTCEHGRAPRRSGAKAECGQADEPGE